MSDLNIDTDGVTEEIEELPKKRYNQLHHFLVQRIKSLNKSYVNNSALFDIYTIILDSIYSFVPKEKMPDTIFLPQYVNILSTGIELKRHLIMTIKRAPMYVGTDNPVKTNPFKNKVQRQINQVSNNALYTISLEKITAHKTTNIEFKEFLYKLYE